MLKGFAGIVGSETFRKPLLPSLVFSFPSCIHVMQQAVFLVVICLHTLIIRMCKWYTYKSITYVNDTHVKHISLFAKNLHFQYTKKFIHEGAKTLVHIPFLKFFLLSLPKTPHQILKENAHKFQVFSMRP